MRVLKCSACGTRMCRLYFQTKGRWMATEVYICPNCSKTLKIVEI